MWGKLLCFLNIHQWEYNETYKKHNCIYLEHSRICKICGKKQLKHCDFDFQFWY